MLIFQENGGLERVWPVTEDWDGRPVTGDRLEYGGKGAVGE
jgi:hypothetical protein